MSGELFLRFASPYPLTGQINFASWILDWTLLLNLISVKWSNL